MHYILFFSFKLAIYEAILIYQLQRDVALILKYVNVKMILGLISGDFPTWYDPKMNTTGPYCL